MLYGISRPSKLGPALVILAALMVVPLLAAINVVIGPYSILPYVAVAATAIFFALPLNWMVLACFLLASVFAGVLHYFGGISQGFWLPYLMGILFAFRAVGGRMRLGAGSTNELNAVPSRQFGSGAQLLGALIIVYLITGLFSTLLALPPMTQVVVASKNYAFLWGLLLVLLWMPWSVQDSKWLWTTVVAVACIQWPVVAYQRFFVAAGRVDAASWDAVVGTFGGDPEGGGHSAAMAFVLCAALAVLLWRIREKRLQLLPGSLLIALCLIPLVLAEVKASFIWLALVFSLFFFRRFVQEPMKAMLTLIIGVLVLTGMAWSYKEFFYAERGSSTFREIYDNQIKYAFDPQEFRPERARLGRVSSLYYWGSQHDFLARPTEAFLGHGLGSSRSSSSLGIGEQVRKTGLRIDTTGMSTLLWDVGLLGASLYLAILVCGAASALRLSARKQLPNLVRESLFASGVVLAMASLGLFYNRDPIDTPAVQVLLFFALAQVFIAKRQLRATPRGRAFADPRQAPAAAQASVP